jgi:hypothetical protein
MSTIFQKYAAALLPFFILVVGASQTVLQDPKNLTVIVTFAILVAGAVATYIVKLLPGGWQGGVKTGIAILTTILSAVLPFLLPGGFTPGANLPVVAVAILNALATEFGVQIRTDPVVSGGVVADPTSVKALPEGNVVQ